MTGAPKTVTPMTVATLMTVGSAARDDARQARNSSVLNIVGAVGAVVVDVEVGKRANAVNLFRGNHSARVTNSARTVRRNGLRSDLTLNRLRSMRNHDPVRCVNHAKRALKKVWIVNAGVDVAGVAVVGGVNQARRHHRPKNAFVTNSASMNIISTNTTRMCMTVIRHMGQSHRPKWQRPTITTTTKMAAISS